LEQEMLHQNGLIINELDNILLDNYWRKFYTYKEVGWDENSIKQYLGQKQFIMQIASFNTRTVSFSASSRRNRYYEVFNRPDMLEKDIAFTEVIPSLQKIAEKYDIFVISSRTTDLQDKTLEVMNKLGFPLHLMKIYFKGSSDVLHNWRQKCINEIVQTLSTGFAVCLMPTDSTMFVNNSYNPIAFTSIKEPSDFNGHIQTVVQSWPQLVQTLGIV
jgi:hypothetical protein